MSIQYTATLTVSRGGYLWRKAKGKDDLELVPLAPGEDDTLDPFAGFDHDGLFLEFAGLSGTDRARLLEFANRYGRLTGDEHEYETTWRDEIGHLRDATRHYPGTEPLRKHSDAVALKGLMMSRMIEVRVIPIPCEDGLQVVHMCPTLRDVIWSQFVDAWTNGYTFAKCPMCSRPFRERKRRKWCRAACRVKHYTTARAEAGRLYKNGETPAKIAEQVGIRRELIIAWLKVDYRYDRAKK